MTDRTPTTATDLRAGDGRHRHKQSAEVDSAMSTFERAYAREVGTLGDRLADRVEGRGGITAGVEDVIRRGVADHQTRFREVFAEGVAAGARAGRRSLSREYGLDVDPDTVPAETLAALEDTVDTLTGPILSTLTDGILADVATVRDDGGGVEEIARALRALGPGPSKGSHPDTSAFTSRGQGQAKLQGQGPTHSQTLVHGAAQRGGHSAMTQAEEVVGERWNTVQDGRQRRTHENADGQIAPPGTAFLVGTARLQHPGDPSAPLDEIINCRCLTTPVFESDLSDGQLATLRLGRTIRG